MSQDLKPIAAKRCYACIQWEGVRSYDRGTQMVKVDVGREGKCLVHRTMVKGSHFCDQFFPLK